MNALATVIACYGLFANSAAVVIGAMVVAMLMGPISGVALGLNEGDRPLLWTALFSLTGGIAWVLLIAAVVGLVHQDVPLTDEILSRTDPRLFDLMIALAGGAAGAVAVTRDYSEQTAREIDCAVRALVDEAAKTAMHLLETYRTQLNEGATALLEKETLLLEELPKLDLHREPQPVPARLAIAELAIWAGVPACLPFASVVFPYTLHGRRGSAPPRQDTT
jgi:uncharacterized hydrophobic protein (TIGR00271 family)